MRTLLLGIDSGTQSTKVLVVDARDGKVLASAAQEYDLIPNLPPGAKEQHPHTSELQSPCNLVCRLLLEKKKKYTKNPYIDRYKRYNTIRERMLCGSGACRHNLGMI